MHKFIFVLLAVVFTARAGTIGSFANTQHQPGYVTSKTNDEFYKGPLKNPTPSKILANFISPDGSINTSSLQQVYLKAKSADEAAFKVICQKEKKQEGADFCKKTIAEFESDKSEAAQKVLKKYYEDERTIARKFAHKEIQRALELSKSLPPLLGEKNLNSPQAYEFYESVFNALDVYASAQLADPTFGSMKKTLGLAKHILMDVVVNSKIEASNLVNPGTGQYTSSRELRQFTDASLLDPKDSGFWRQPTKPISSFDTSNYDGKARADEDLQNPKVATDVVFDKAKSSGATTKMDVKIGDRTFKMKFFVKGPRPFDMNSAGGALKAYDAQTHETQTEFVVNNLSAALGFTVDPTFYKEKLRLFVKDDFKSDEIDDPKKRDAYAQRFTKALEAMIKTLEETGTVRGSEDSGFNWNYRAALSTVKSVQEGEQRGRMYVEVENASLEQKSDNDNEVEVGGFNKIENGRSLKREFRAYQLFYAWISDTDSKDANSDLKLVKVKDKNGQDTYKLVYSASDMGASLGWMFGNGTPNEFGKDLVNPKLTDTDKGVLAIKLNMYAVYDLWKAVSFNDARWMARLIGQLTPEQIRKTLRTAGYPQYVSEVFTQKLLRRRDQLITATGLMGTTVRAHGTGELLTLRPESEIKDGVPYKVAGFEECFDDNGKLIEVTGKCDKKWATGRVEEGSAEKELLNTLLYADVPKIAEPFIRKLQRFEFMRPLSSNEGSFFEGVSVGVDSFIPARYIVANPLKEDIKDGEPKVWWIVDVFRTGYGVKRASQLDTRFNAAGYELTPADTSANLKFGKTWETIRIRAVRDPKEFADGIVKIYAPEKMFVTAMRDLNQKLVDDMQPGDVIITSTYLSAGFALKFTPIVTATTLISPEFKIGASHAVTNRQTVIKSDNSKLLLNWQDLNKSDLGGNISLKVFLFNLGGLRTRLTKLSQSDRLYEFDTSVEPQKTLMSKSFHRSLPEFRDKADQALFKSLAVSEKNRKQTENLISLGFLGLPNFLNYKRAQEVIVRDPQTGEIKEAYLSRKKGKNTSGFLIFSANVLNSNSVSSEATSDKDGKMFAKFRVDYSRSWAKRSHFKDVFEKLLPLLPESLVQFGVNDVCDTLGTLGVDGEIIYSSEALQEIFSRNLTTEQACQLFTNSIQKSVPEVPQLCNTAMDNIDVLKISERLGRTSEDSSRIRSALLATRNFTTNFVSAQKYFNKKGNTTLTPDGKKSVQHALQKVVTLLETRPLRNHVLSAVQSLTSNAKLYRMATIKSSLGCLPKQETEITLNKVDRGGYTPTALETSESIMNYTDTQIDAVHDAVRKYFFDFLYKNSIQAPKAASI